MRRALRFVLFTTFYPPYSFGGDAIHVRALARALVAAGHRVEVIHCADAFHLFRARAVPPPADDDIPGLTVHRLESGLGFVSPLLSHQTGQPYLKSAAIRALLDRIQPDVIHYHNISLLGPAVLSLAPAGGNPVKLYTLHEYWLVCPTHVLWKFNRRPCEKRECLRCTLAARRPPQLWRYNGALARHTRAVDAFLAPSRFAMEMHERYGFTQPMTHFPLFIEHEDEALDESPPHPRPYFLFVGRLEAVKNPASLVDTWMRYTGADLLVAGTGSEEPALRARAAANPRIRFLGAVPQAELPRYYAHSIACVVPSSMQEVFPLVVLEAFARGAPVIVRDRGALAEMVEVSGGGLVYRDDDELPAALERLAQSPALRATLGANGQRVLGERWSKAAHLSNYFALIDTIARRKYGALPWQLAPQEPVSPIEA
jgi:glycosyltransferase involved in cell wall biosynthesis